MCYKTIMRFSRLFTVCLFIAALFGTASTAFPSEFSGLPITGIILKDDQGAPLPDAGELLPLLEVRQGSTFSPSAVRQGIGYLYLTGRFSDIRVEGFPDGGGVRLEYSFVPVVRVDKIVIRGSSAVAKSRIRDILAGIEGKELREEKLGELRSDILGLYQVEGFYDTVVEFRRKPLDSPHLVCLIAVITEGEPVLVEEIRFIGNSVFSGKELLRSLANRRGKPLRRDQLLDDDREALLRKYAEAGYPVARIGPVTTSFRNKRAFVTLEIDEGQKLEVNFTGNRRFSSRELSRALLVWEERDLSDAVIESSQASIETLYRREGYADATVKIATSTAPGSMRLDVTIQEGQRVTVSVVTFEGNVLFDGKQLRKSMDLRESGWFWSRPFEESVLERDLDAIRDRYRNAGYLECNVEKSVRRSPDGRKASVNIKIAEGKRTVVGDIAFEGNRVFTTGELAALIETKQGEPFLEQTVEEDRHRILTAYGGKGYLVTRVEAETADRNGVRTLRFSIDEGRPVAIGKIILRGTVRTKEKVLRRELLVHEGDPYDYGAILKSQQRLYRLGFLGSARFEPLRIGEQEDVKDILLSVEERPAGALELGFGYGNLDRFRGSVQLSHSNLWGTARTASIRFEGSDIAEQAIFTFREPWLFGERLEARLRLTWSDTTRLNPDTREIYYQTRKSEVSTGVEKTIDELKLSLVYQFENVQNYNVATGAVLSRDDVGRVLVSSVTPGLIWDLRDDPFNPRRGSLHGIAVKEAPKALASEAYFTKATFQSSWFIPVGKTMVIALSGRAGRAWPHGETTEVPLHERFYTGGGSTIRGYLQDSVGPRKVNIDGTITPTGGDRMVLMNLEFRIGRPEGLGVVFFADSGNVWVNEAVDFDSLRASAGIGIRYQTPVGPLRLDYGQKTNRQGARFLPSAVPGAPPVIVQGESPGEVHFNIGHAF